MKKTALAIAVATAQITGCQIPPSTEATLDIGETNYTAQLEELKSYLNFDLSLLINTSSK